jgi:hypothetical protein
MLVSSRLPSISYPSGYACHPLHISRLVIPNVAEATEFCSFGSQSHVGKKRFKAVSPSVANLNTLTAIRCPLFRESSGPLSGKATEGLSGEVFSHLE